MLLLLACAEPEPADTAPPAVYEPWVYEEETAAPTGEGLDPAALDAAVEEVFVAFHRLDPGLPSLTYVAALETLGEDCPTRSIYNGQDFATGDCEGAAGGAFYGYQLSTRLQEMQLPCGEDDAQMCWTRDSRWMTGVSHVETPDGLVLESMGDAYFRDYDDLQRNPSYETYIWGDFRSENGADDWLAESLGMQFYVNVTNAPYGKQISWNGGVSRLPGTVLAFWAEELVLSEVEGACPLEPTGGLHVYDAAAVWYDLVADSECDGCLAASSRGVDLGFVCNDWSTLLQWETSPWE